MCWWAKSTSSQVLWDGQTTSPTKHHEPSPRAITDNYGCKNPGIHPQNQCLESRLHSAVWMCKHAYEAHVATQHGPSRESLERTIRRHGSHRLGFTMQCRHPHGRASMGHFRLAFKKLVRKGDAMRTTISKIGQRSHFFLPTSRQSGCFLRGAQIL